MEAAMEAATEGAEWFEVAFEFNYCTVPLRVLFIYRYINRCGFSYVTTRVT